MFCHFKNMSSHIAVQHYVKQSVIFDHFREVIACQKISSYFVISIFTNPNLPFISFKVISNYNFKETVPRCLHLFEIF